MNSVRRGFAVRRGFGLPVPLVRHGVIVVVSAAAVVAQGGTLSVSVFSQPWSWFAVAIALGIVSAIIGRGLLGVVFLLLGFGIGVQALLVAQLGTWSTAQTALGRDGYLYGAMLAAAVEAYLLTALVLVWIRHRRAPQRRL